MVDRHADRLRIELEPGNDGTTTLTCDGAGWHECLARLEADLDGAPEPAPGAVWSAVHPSYVSTYGPQAATIGPPEG